MLRRKGRRFAAESQDLATRRGKSLLELTNESCRWPMGRRGKYLFCGVAEADVLCGIPYCARHMRRAYTDAVSFEKSRRGEFARDVKPSNVGVRA